MIDVQMNEQSARLLRDAMKAAERKTDWVIEKQSNKAMYYICRSAGAAMKPKSMAGKRRVYDNPARKTRKNPTGKGARYLIEVLHQDKPTTFLRANRKTDKRRKIAKLGLARTVMSLAAGKFGRSPSTKMVKGASKFYKTIKKHAAGRHKVSVIAALTYLFDAFPGVVDRSIKKGMTSFIREFDRDWATALKKA